MTETIRSVIVVAQYFLNRLAVAVFALAALGLTLATALAAFGVLPWLEFQVSFGGQVYENAGKIAQIGLTVLAVLLCFYLPANARVMALENSHRRFHMNMQDVTQAYAAAHAADRAGMFRIQSEFDAVRERLAYMREHPDLESLEPQIMEVAAQMSYISRELAEIYSDDKVDRARAFLKQRQQEVEQFNKRLDHAKAVGVRLKQWAQEVEMEESVAVSQLERLRDDLRPILPELGYEEVSDLDGTVVGLPNRAAE
ncbi:DNA repair protein [Roseovarius atlanticus]|uniref:DNA repair protein n=1 Tax=Roseovarius atlanticus TaxID=1641875 RepID=UPI001C96AE93|nr:DNA repair protein [Roseovarius atlanticus]MBY5989069.1 DNA repair protein [Roseovarius atlanticus]MBY6124461.1 DNA repair protein [Roseovarius atlanticus]MBY6148956.1 DNA repair protein [Roseovarius atlanticus]